MDRQTKTLFFVIFFPLTFFYLFFSPLSHAAEQTFTATGGPQIYVVPPGITSIDVVMAGAKGSDNAGNTAQGGRGATVSATLAVTPGEVLQIMVGNSFGFNGGQSGGGGASDIRRPEFSTVSSCAYFLSCGFESRLVVAGGGGGAGTFAGAHGGDAGPDGSAGANGGSGSTAGGGGTQVAGGDAGTSSGGGATGFASAGSFGVGGILGWKPDHAGGGGGGGYFGGGGGGGATGVGASGGGGGSSWGANASLGVTNFVNVDEPNNDDGYVLISEASAIPEAAFAFTGGAQSYTVPDGVTELAVMLRGGAGAAQGDVVWGRLPVSSGQVLEVVLGGRGGLRREEPLTGNTIGGEGGFNGGGASTLLSGGSWGGGGASDIRVAPYSLEDRVVVAGGGGGTYGFFVQFGWFGANGGAFPNGEGGTSARNFFEQSGAGGTFTAGGRIMNPDGLPDPDAPPETAGDWLTGGTGVCCAGYQDRAGGGGGYYGGAAHFGGGGGSSYATVTGPDPTRQGVGNVLGQVAAPFQHLRGGNAGDGAAVITAMPIVTTGLATLNTDTVDVVGTVNPKYLASSLRLQYAGSLDDMNNGFVSDGTISGPLGASILAGDTVQAVSGSMPSPAMGGTFYYRVCAQSVAGLACGAVESITRPALYVVTFVDWNDQVVSTIEIPPGENGTFPTLPERTGYTFTGWLPSDLSTITGDTTVVPQYTINSYAVTISISGAGTVEPPSRTVDYGQTASFDLVLQDPDDYVRLDSTCGAARSGDTIVTSAIEDACSITATVYPSVQIEAQNSTDVAVNEARSLTLSGGAGSKILSSVQQTRADATETLSGEQGNALLTLQPDGSYLFSATQTGRYTLEFIDEVTGQLRSTTFDVLPYIAFTSSKQTVQQSVPTSISVWLSDEPITYPVTVSFQPDNAEVDAERFEIDSFDALRATYSVTVIEPGDALVSLTDAQLTNALMGTPRVQNFVVIDEAPPLSLSATASQNAIASYVVATTGGLVSLLAREKDNTPLTFTWEVDGITLTTLNENASFDPSALAPGRYIISITGTDGTRTGQHEIAITVIDHCPVDDCSDTGVSGIPASQNPFAGVQNRLPLCPVIGGNDNRVDNCENETTVIYAEVPNQYSLSLGLFSSDLSWETGQFGVAVDDDYLTDAGYNQFGFIVNFDITGLESPGEAVPVLIPLPRGLGIPANAVWRKYIGNQWGNFVIDDANQVESAARDGLNNCPGVSSDVWTTGLTAGHGCIRITIEDGGPNDDDGSANGVIRDPGVLASVDDFTITFDSAGGSAIDSITLAFGEPVAPPADPVRPGYTFAGWTPALPSTMPAEDVTITAQWFASSAKVTTKDGGSLSWLSIFALMLLGLQRCKRLRALMLLLLVPSSAWALDLAATVQIGTSRSDDFGSSQVRKQLDSRGIDATAEIDQNSDTAYRIAIGYPLSEMWHVELAWVDLGEAVIKYDQLPRDTTDEVLSAQPQRGTGPELSIVMYFPQFRELKPYFRLGVMRNTSEYEFEGPDYRFTEEEDDVTLGGELGLRYPIMQQLDLGIAAAFYDTDRYDTYFFSLGLLYRFGI